MSNKGTCQKHGEFILTEGCPQCLAEKRGESIPEVIEAETSTTTAIVQIEPQKDTEVINLYNEALKLQEYAESRVVATVDDMKPATDDLNIISKLKKALEEKRKEYTQPINDHLKAVNEAFKTLMEPIEQADSINREKILAFQLKQKLIREEQERINALRLEAAQKEMELKGEITESVDLVEVSPEAPKRVSTEMGTIGQRDNWKWEVMDFSLVPDEYKMINAGILTPVVKASKGKIVIPGIKIFNEPILAVNTK